MQRHALCGSRTHAWQASQGLQEFINQRIVHAALLATGSSRFKAA